MATAFNYFSIVTYLLPDAGQEMTFNIPFPYLRRQDLVVYRNGVQLYRGSGDGQFEIETEGASQLVVHGTLISGDKIVLRRYTRKDQRMAEYYNGAVLTENDLNIVTVQMLYLIQELFDYIIASGSGDPPPGGPGGSIGGEDPGEIPDIIQQIIDELLNSQLFKDLTTLIPLTDINAELIMSQIANVHERWSQDRTYAGLIRQLDTGLQEIDTRFTNQIEELVDENEARITQIVALQARMGDAEADIIETRTAVANVDFALTEWITVSSSRFAANESRIGHIETTYASLEYTESYVQTQLDSRFTQSNLDTFINASSAIQGIRTRADAQGASVEAVTSYIAGSNVTIGPDGSIAWGTPTVGSLAYSLSGVQTTQAAHATQLSTEASFRTALASRFSPANPGAANNPTQLAAAIETSYRTYADVNSTVASRATQLEVSRVPILFRPVAPNPYADAIYTGTWFATNGFPNGSIWYKQNGNSLKPFYWNATAVAPPVPPPLEFYGPFNSKPGMWFPSRDTDLQASSEAFATNAANAARNSAVAVMAGQIEELAETYMDEDEVIAQISSTLTTVYNAPNLSAVQAINERLYSYINADTGTMYSNWTVRINQYAGTNTPVIAGVGLGMQYDLNNPNAAARSQFIIMANTFGVIAPPPINQDPLTGNVNLATVKVPFVIDSSSGTVGIDGTLIVKGSLRAYEGVMARLTFTDLDNNLLPINPNGMRLVLPSGTANLNASTSSSPFPGGSNPQRFLVWAGSGSMNHNNATFYVDTDGNAKFEGTIDAENITGAVNNLVLVNENFGTVVSGAGVQWQDLPATPTLPMLNGQRERSPFATISVALFGGGVQRGAARLMMRYEYTPNLGDWSAWTEVAYGYVATPTGTTLTLSGGLGLSVAGRVQLKVQIGPVPDSPEHRPHSNRYQGTFIGAR